MFLQGDCVVTSASDLASASTCEFAFLRALDAKLGRIEAVIENDDPLRRRAAGLGIEHERRVLERYREEFGDGVVAVSDPFDKRDGASVAAAVAQTLAAFTVGAPVIFQACFRDKGFIGFADFIVRQHDGRYLVQDTKLARRAKVSALLQLAAYAEQLDRLGIPRTDTVELLLGDGAVSSHRLDDIAPVYRRRRARLEQIVAERLADSGPVVWGDPRYECDGRCDTCVREIERTRSVLLVAGLRTTQATSLAEVGVNTIEELAVSTGSVPGILDATLANLRAQAGLQIAAEEAEARAAVAEVPVVASGGGGVSGGEVPVVASGGEVPVVASGDGVPVVPTGDGVPVVLSAGRDILPPPIIVRDASALGAIPPPSPGDLFFDFEGDPLYTEGKAEQWGIDYLFGMVDSTETFTSLWAHSFRDEKAALEGFLDLVALRRAAHPDMHVYHYADYERAHLRSIAARHGVREAEVDQLLRDSVLVDLFPIIKRAVLVGSRSYSLKKLEALYMGSQLREAEVKNGAESIGQYVRARELAESDAIEEETGLPGRIVADRILADIADYNRYDCISTLRLRDWLLARAQDAGVRPVVRVVGVEREHETSPLAAVLRDWAGSADGRDSDHTALALAGAAIGYHEREEKSFWWAHFFRAEQPMELWEEQRNVIIVDPAASRVRQGWVATDHRRVERRLVELRGRVALGSRFSVGAQLMVLYEPPAPCPQPDLVPGSRMSHRIIVREVLLDGLLVEETAINAVTWNELPSAVVPGPPPPAGRQRGAIEEWAAEIVSVNEGGPVADDGTALAPIWPKNAVIDILRRMPPRTRDGCLIITTQDDPIVAITEAILRLDSSYLAVQGPPGTGKTYCGSHVIAALVREHHMKIGVVAQSHAVIENLLGAVVAAGVPPELVGKVPKDASATAATAAPVPSPVFRALAKNQHARFTAEQAESGFVLGGTAWDFANAGRVARGLLDLLVIDEAGQFSLASTIAAGVSARNLLLLGDPQQLPQVSQNSHPEPIDESVLGWVAQDHDVLPSGFGVFLAESRRLHPAVAAPVSALSYGGELRSHPSASERTLLGVEPGLHPVPIRHEGNTTGSVEEAEQVVDIIRSLQGSSWLDSGEGGGPRPLDTADFIVVTPYNAQLVVIEEALVSAGFGGVAVGTVDKFQGQEAVIAIVSLAASSSQVAPRGLEFLLLKNRLNVAISRAKWAAYLVYSPELADGLPHTVEGVARVSAFIRLIESQRSDETHNLL
ncbi:MAG: hypothetical protein B5766_11070 [Candidatus Lumbricidophila eiseniae]|uniref:DNA helicase n=1 Tax=Candidatus Lumbricidiphila eiseniae TaxID=1969409 RepID=A0A2A6FNJ7_9MICO|nr:MAG: hypothetical protein B5766_11070 [Candidatus Lumbricidophila eiseniae]